MACSCNKVVEADGPEKYCDSGGLTAPGVVGPAYLAVQDGGGLADCGGDSSHVRGQADVVQQPHCVDLFIVLAQHGTCHGSIAHLPKSIRTVENGHRTVFKVDRDLADTGFIPDFFPSLLGSYWWVLIWVN